MNYVEISLWSWDIPNFDEADPFSPFTKFSMLLMSLDEGDPNGVLTFFELGGGDNDDDGEVDLGGGVPSFFGSTVWKADPALGDVVDLPGDVGDVEGMAAVTDEETGDPEGIG